MAYRVAKGTVSIDGKSPDGDTLAFKIDDPEDWVWPKNQNGRFPKLNSKYQANIRFEAIDALELHFTIQYVHPHTVVKQKTDLALAARDELLTLCGFDLTNIEESADYRISDPDQQEMSVTLAYNGIDPFGRLIGFVFVDDIEFDIHPKYGTARISPEQVSQSVNAKLLEKGLVYPTFYGGLYPQLRNTLKAIAKEAQQPDSAGEKKGIWKYHQSEFMFSSKTPRLEELENIVMMPKLFRRLSSHLAHKGAISDFKRALGESNDLVVDTRDIRLTDFSKFIRWDENSNNTWTVGLTHEPDELVFVPA